MTKTETPTEETITRHKAALATALGASPEDFELLNYDHYGLAHYSLGRNQEYAIGTDSEADEAVERNIRDSVWAFNSDFILSHCDLPRELIPAFQSYQQTGCEGANDALVALIEKCGNFSQFVQEAVSADGRGHFLSGYDGNEIEEGDFFIYRTN